MTSRHHPLAPAASTPIEAALLATLRALSPADKLALASRMNQMADCLALGGIRQRQPTASHAEHGLTLALQRLLPEQQAHAARILEGSVLMPTPADPETHQPRLF